MVSDLELNLIQRVAVGDIIRRQAERLPWKEALVETRENRIVRLTYHEFNECTNRLGRALRGLGLGKGDRVATVCNNSAEFVITAYALAKSGMVWVPVNPGLGLQDIRYIVNHSEARAVMVDDTFTGLLDSIAAELPGPENIVCLPVTGAVIPENYREFWSLLEQGAPGEIEDVVIHDRDLVQIMYTSGTTAAPKGVMLSNLNVFVVSLANCIELEIGRDRVCSCLMPFFHAAQHTLITSAFHVGAKVVVMRGFDTVRVLEAVQREKITNLFILPAMYGAVLDHPDFDRYDVSSLAHCIYAMTPMDQRTLEQAVVKLGARFALGTGQTEAYPSSNNFLPEWQMKKSGNYWGISSPVFDTAVMDEGGRFLPAGQVGEIVWRSPAVMEGYWKDPGATAEGFRFGWRHSGDMGCFDEDGLLVFMDRQKDMIKSGGENVPSIKVERVILGDPRVQGCAVIGLPHPRWIEGVTAVVEPKPGSGVTEEDIINLCKMGLGGFEVPKAVIFVDNLPRTTTGKVQKHVLRGQYRDIYQS
ncbi:MAG: AMP-binding protein [Peptococcaceae bacterium]|jgi:long-chain acyl-CoA synthetase|nr:AMP-binding protein [Peptococcaceae bacterium]